MAQASMFKVNQLAKDLGMKNKEILAKIEGSGITVKSYMATLDPDEFNLFFDELTRENQIKDLVVGILHHLLTRNIRVSIRSTRKKQSQKIIDLCDSANSRTRIARSGLLVNADDWR